VRKANQRFLAASRVPFPFSEIQTVLIRLNTRIAEFVGNKKREVNFTSRFVF
jgi:hypothetical protein